MIEELLKEAEHKMEKTVEKAAHEFSTIRTGRANPAILEHVMVDYYGTPTPINHIATITVPEPRLLLIQPYDKQSLAWIEKAILKSDLNLVPNNDGQVIRIRIPELTEERRKELIKLLHKKAEDERVAIRNVRREVNEHLKAAEKKGEISEDDVKRAEQQVQKLTDKYIAEIDRLQKAKEDELMEV
ncbi:MAG: ribosome-recycling factor [Armatimonadota bacterium]|nr:MAG: ribosome-recycling factor [Armatimonadota bacterium]